MSWDYCYRMALKLLALRSHMMLQERAGSPLSFAALLQVEAALQHVRQHALFLEQIIQPA